MIEEFLRSRRSIRRFKPEPVEAALIERLLEAAVTAPSAGNKQPWRFWVVERRDVIDAMAAAVREASARLEASIPEESRDAFHAYGDYFTRFEAAPVVIVPIFRGAQVLSHLAGPSLPAAEREALRTLERDNGLLGTSLAVGNLLLVAHALGLGASAMTGPLIAAPALHRILEIPASWGITCVVALGWPDEIPEPTERKPASRVTRWF
jgi:nitroreductase